MAPPRKYDDGTTMLAIRIPNLLLDAVKLAAFVDGNRPVSEIVVETLRERFTPPSDGKP